MQQTSGTTSPLYAVAFTDESTGIIVGPGGLILSTTDGGTTWLQQISGTMNWLYGVSFSNLNYGTVVGNGGTILRTTNGGTTWEPQISGTINDLWSVSFTDTEFGTIVGGDRYSGPGIILRTTDGGATWEQKTSGTINTLHSVSFTDANTGTVVGKGGTILRTTNGGISFVDEKEIDEAPTEFLLEQNYPNPFNPSTKIKYSIPQTSNVVIKVFDILGNEIETILSEEKTAGTYEITWYADGLPSGIYFYQLKAGDFLQTKKMLLLK
jgi:hypothetical protein